MSATQTLQRSDGTDSAQTSGIGVDPELVRQVADEVYRMLMQELRHERERSGLACRQARTMPLGRAQRGGS